MLNYSPDSRFGYALELLMVAALYVVSARLGQAFAISPGNVTPVWIPSGLMIALTYKLGYRIWPGVFIGAFAGNAWAYLSFDTFQIALSAILAGICNGIGDVLSTVVAAQLIIYFTGRRELFSSLRAFGVFLLFGVFLGPVVSALFGVTSLVTLGFIEWPLYLITLMTWWTGDGVGALLIAPLIIAFFSEREKHVGSSPAWLRYVVLLACFFCTSVFFGIMPVSQWLVLLCIAIIPLLVMGMLMINLVASYSIVVMISAVAILATSQNKGPFSVVETEYGLLILQLFLAVLTSVIYLVSIIVMRKRDSEGRLKRSENNLAQAQRLAHLGSWELDLVRNQLDWSDEVYRIFCVSPGEFENTYDAFLTRVHPEDREFVDQSFTQALQNKTAYDIEHRLLLPDGGVKFVNECCETQFDKQGKPIRCTGTVFDITERIRSQEKIVQQAHYDSLTGLPNRFLSLDRLSQQIRESLRDKSLMALLFIDLDDFKKINDSLGHEVGDNILIEAAKRLQSVVRSGDTVGRLGGDEFIVLLRGLSSTADSQSVADNLLNAFRDSFLIDKRELILTASVGIAIYPDDGGDSSELLRNADSAMYHAKKNGRNTYSYYTYEMNNEVSRRLAVEEQLRGAMERRELYVVYQPQVDVMSGEMVGCEALLRWNNPVLGEVYPDEFISIAEHTGVIVPIGEFVILDALQVVSRMRKDYSKDFKVAVNLSPRQFRDPGLVSFIEMNLRQSQLPCECLELEITEGVLMSGYSYIDKALSTLDDIGVSIAMDDFGTGYSSLNYLRQYPFHILKIDRSFIQDIDEKEKEEGKELVNAAISMAHALGLKVVAEGVEKGSQWEILKSLGCDYAQGYLFSRPMPIEDVLVKLRS